MAPPVCPNLQSQRSEDIPVQTHSWYWPDDWIWGDSASQFLTFARSLCDWVSLFRLVQNWNILLLIVWEFDMFVLSFKWKCQERFSSLRIPGIRITFGDGSSPYLGWKKQKQVEQIWPSMNSFQELRMILCSLHLNGMFVCLCFLVPFWHTCSSDC